MSTDNHKWREAAEFLSTVDEIEVRIKADSTITPMYFIADALANAYNAGYDAGVADENEFWHSNKR